MGLNIIDWFIVGFSLVLLLYSAHYSGRYNKSVADFLSANRCAARYILCISEGAASLAAVGIIASFERSYQAGFSSVWWEWMTFPIMYIITLSGWIIYRFRETRSMTMGQFFEIRYSKNFRLFCGILAFLSGIINFGIFPAVGARFFTYFFNLPVSFSLMGINISTYPIVVATLILISLYFTFTGGQVTIILTGFIQGLFCNIMLIFILIYLLVVFNWPTIIEGLETAPPGQSMLNPFDTADTPTFNPLYFLIVAFHVFYSHKTWQGLQGYNSSAKNAHEAKMAGILSTWRRIMPDMLFVFLPIVGYVIMNHLSFADTAQNVRHVIGTIDNNYLQTQARMPIVLRYILPHGLLGALATIMLSAFISTSDSYLHSWGVIFIQDVVLPFRKKPFTPKQHMILLRCAVVCIAIFIFFWAMLFRQDTYILLYFMITGAIYISGAGAVIVGGLYWKRGSTAGAWCAMIIGAVLSVGSMILKKSIPGDFAFTDAFPASLLNPVVKIITGKAEHIILFWCIIASSSIYVLVSLLGSMKFDMTRMLHRGKYTIKSDKVDSGKEPLKGLKALGITHEFNLTDKIIYVSTIVWGLVWFLIFIAGTVYNLTHEVSNSSWAKFWRFYVYLFSFIGLGTSIWFAIGGIKDAINMIKTLKSAKRNDLDDGTVVDHRNLSDLEAESKHT